MKRALALALALAFAVALALVACDGGGGEDHASGRASCHAQTTCGACTPIVGCGWCALSGGDGVCVDGPDDCPDASTRFDWDPPGCDAAARAGTSDASSATGRIRADAAVASDASDASDAAHD